MACQHVVFAEVANFVVASPPSRSSETSSMHTTCNASLSCGRRHCRPRLLALCAHMHEEHVPQGVTVVLASLVIR